MIRNNVITDILMLIIDHGIILKIYFIDVILLNLLTKEGILCNEISNAGIVLLGNIIKD